MVGHRNKYSLGQRLLFLILLVSSCVTLFTTGLQLYLDYRRDINLIESRIQQIRDIHLRSLASHLWEYDIGQIHLQLDGILRLPDMEFLEVYNESETVTSLGMQKSANTIEQIYPIIYDNLGTKKKLADLKIVASLDEVHSRLKEKFLTILGFQAIKTFLVSIFILFIIQYLVTRHLKTMANYADNFDFDRLSQPLTLNKKSNRYTDEIDIVVNSLNDMRLKLQDSYLDLEQKNKELLKMDQLKDQFLANTSHELRTPLNGIIGIAETMANSETENYSPGTINNLSLIVSSGRRLYHLINDILDFSKLRHGDIALKLKSIDIKSVVDVVLSLSKVQISEKSLDVTNSIPARLPLARGDELRIQQVLHNLVGNAVKFTNEGKIEIGATRIDGFLQISIEDTGIGIRKEHIAGIFNSFEQSDGSAMREYPGAGLGLSISKKLVLLHGGQIHVQSEYHKGTKVSFTLPIDKKSTARLAQKSKLFQSDPVSPVTAGPDKATANSANTKKAPYSILIVDDELIIRQVLQNYLKDENYDVQSLPDGEKTLETVNRKKPDLILLDIMMPRMNGFDVCQKIRERFSANELPIIMLSARNQLNDRLLGMSVGANDYLEKPVYRHELIARIQSQIRLLNANRRIKSFLDFSRRIGEFKDSKALISGAFEQIEENVYFNVGILVQSGEIIQHSGNQELGEYLFKKYSGRNIGEKDLLAERISGDFPGSVLYTVINGFEEFSILLYRSELNVKFEPDDRQYIENILYEVNSIRQNISLVTEDNQRLEAISILKREIERIKYIKSVSPYCEIFTDHSREKIEALISMQEIELYFGEQVLFRVHRKYFVNPEKAKKIRKKNPKDFELIFDDATIPIGRTYLKKLKQRHSYLFNTF